MLEDIMNFLLKLGKTISYEKSQVFSDVNNA